MIKLRWLKKYKGSKIGDSFESSKKSAENFVSQGYAEYVKVEKPKKVAKKKSIKQLKEEAIKSGMPKKDAEEIESSIEKADEIKARIKEEEDKITDDETKILLGEIFEDIKYVLKRYIKLKEEYYNLVAIWIVGTYCIKNFETYPYLFINAQKGSGKTRLLKLIEALVNNGELLVSMREAVLFRIANDDKTILIDELEGLDRKENAPLKELLNACYKRGTKVYRMRKQGDSYIAEAFYPFTPIAIANISGLDEVLEDRCIAIRLTKSSKSTYSLLQEDFLTSPIIKQIKENFSKVSVGLCRLCKRIYTLERWNNYLDYRYPSTTLHTLHTYPTPLTHKKEENNSYLDVCSVYNKIIDSGITGRHLELIFPLLMVSLMINNEMFEKFLKLSKTLSEKKKEDDVIESKDVSLIEFISKMSSELDSSKFRFVYEMNDRFRFFLGIRKEREQEDINPEWMGRALKRLGLVIEKRRLSSGVEVKLNVIKAKKLLEMFK